MYQSTEVVHHLVLQYVQKRACSCIAVTEAA